MPPRSSDLSADEKRGRILEAAYEVCAQRGVEGARMDEVAARAQVSKGTLYHFFESKQDLFLAATIDSYEESLRIHDTARDDLAEDPRVRLDQILDGMTKVHAAMATRMTVHYQAWGVVAGDAGARERLYGFLVDFFDERSANIFEVIRDGQRRGVFDADVDAAAVTDGIMALLSGFLYRATFDPGHADPKRLNACFDALVRDPCYLPPTVAARPEAGDG
jgi:TetR/AcrR family transcriptional regulator